MRGQSLVELTVDDNSATSTTAAVVIGMDVSQRVCHHILREYVHKGPSMDQPSEVANPARGKLNREKSIFPCLSPFVRA